MRKILKIAKVELNILFYSPVAWLVLTIFMIQCAITFLDNLQDTRTTLSLGYQTMPITRSLFSGNGGLFTVMQGYIYLYIPILTMGLMSRETSSGSIKLLLSSPVRLRQIILGKYLAIIGYGLALICILTIFGLIGSFFVKNVDLGLIFSGLTGLYLLICTYAAIGLFMSSLTTYQVVAAISTLAVFACLRYVGGIGQELDFIRDLTYFLSISGRTETMISGMITTKDVFYYLIIISFFLSLCILRLKSERELKPLTIKIGRYILLVCVALGIGYITSRPMFTGYLDTTDLKSLTITKSSQNIAAKINGPLKVTTYANMLAPNLWNVLPASRNYDLGRLESFKRFIPSMDVDYVYYYQKPLDTLYQEFRSNPNLKGVTNLKDIAEKMSTTMGINGDIFIPPTEVNKRVNLESEGYMLVRKLEFKGKQTYLRFLNSDTDPYAGEAEVDAALKRLLVKAPKAVFLTGNNERSIDSRSEREYRDISALKTRRNALINQGFDVDTVNINHQAIPDNADVVILADPTVSFSPAGQQKIAGYLAAGGNMLITGEPGRQHILNPILQQIGLSLKPGILVKSDKNVTPGFINARLSTDALGIDSNISRLQKRGRTVSVQGSAGIAYTLSNGFKVTPMLLSEAGGWNKQLAATARMSAVPKVVVAPIRPAGVIATSGGGASIIVGSNNIAPNKIASIGSLDLATANLNFDPAKGDEKGVFPISVAVTRNINGKQQRIVVCGDADFISNGELSRPRARNNEDYLQGLFRWFSSGQFPIDVSRPDAKDRDLKISRGQITLLMWLCKGTIPALIAIMGSIILFKRRRN